MNGLYTRLDRNGRDTTVKRSDGIPLERLKEEPVPGQAFTAVIYCGWGIAGVYLFLKEFYSAAFFTTLAVTQAWRIVSEFFRADYRGGGKISAYQMMGATLILYAFLIVFLFSTPAMSRPDLVTGLRYLWRPEMILFLQVLWIAVFLHIGRSRVTGSLLSFHVIRQRI